MRVKCIFGIIGLVFCISLFKGGSASSSPKVNDTISKVSITNVSKGVITPESINGKEPLEKVVVINRVYNNIKKVSIGTFNLTAYCPCTDCCGQFGGSAYGKTTSIKVEAHEGVTVAVDPAIIPYGTKLYIEGLGVRIASDCGGAIKGGKIDVYFASHKSAEDFGKKSAEVFILK